MEFATLNEFTYLYNFSHVYEYNKRCLMDTKTRWENDVKSILQYIKEKEKETKKKRSKKKKISMTTTNEDNNILSCFRLPASSFTTNNNIFTYEIEWPYINSLQQEKIVIIERKNENNNNNSNSNSNEICVLHLMENEIQFDRPSVLKNIILRFKNNNSNVELIEQYENLNNNNNNNPNQNNNQPIIQTKSFSCFHELQKQEIRHRKSLFILYVIIYTIYRKCVDTEAIKGIISVLMSCFMEYYALRKIFFDYESIEKLYDSLGNRREDVENVLHEYFFQLTNDQMRK